MTKFIPALWVRCAVLVGFTGFMAYRGVTLIAIIGGALLILTLVQLYQAYRQR